MLRTTAYPVACYWMLVRVVGSCYICLHTTANTDAATPLPTLLTQQCWKLLLRPFARSFTDHLRECIWTSAFCCCFFVFLFCLFLFFILFLVFVFLFFCCCCCSFQHFAVLYKFYFCHLKLSGKAKCKY